MGGFRAKDADRERYVDVIESAYVDGQLGEQDRELRVSRALTAETLDELDALTRDLQNQPAPVVVHQTPAPRVVAPTPAARPVPPVLPSTSHGEGLRFLGFIATAVFAVVVLGMMASAQDDADPFSDDYEYAVPWEPDADAPGLDYRLAAPGVRTFLRRYEAKFDTNEAYEVTFFSNRVTAHVPVGGARARVEVWTWDGGWRRDTEAQPVEGPAGTVDLRTLDVPQLFDNVAVAKQDLGVSDAALQRVEVRPTADGVGSVTIHVRNGATDSAYLETTPQGSRLRAVPYEG